LLRCLPIAVVVDVEAPLYRFEPVKEQRKRHKVRNAHHINQQEEEVLAVPKPNTIIDPGTVVVHIEHAAIANGAVVAALRLKDVAHEAVATAFLLWIAQMEAPEHGYLSGVRSHCLDETPDEHEEQQVEHYEQKHDP